MLGLHKGTIIVGTDEPSATRKEQLYSSNFFIEDLTEVPMITQVPL
jgi:hypothetical protein